MRGGSQPSIRRPYVLLPGGAWGVQGGPLKSTTVSRKTLKRLPRRPLWPPKGAQGTPKTPKSSPKVAQEPQRGQNHTKKTIQKTPQSRLNHKKTSSWRLSFSSCSCSCFSSSSVLQTVGRVKESAGTFAPKEFHLPRRILWRGGMRGACRIVVVVVIVVIVVGVAGVVCFCCC